MLTLQKMLQLTPAAVQKGSKNTHILKAVVGQPKGKGKILKCVVQRTSSDKIKHGRHMVEIESLTPGPDSRLFVGPVKVACSCEAFTFWGIEWVLHQKKAADIRYSNGKAPDIRNPGRKIFLCPHLTKVALGVIRKKM